MISFSLEDIQEGKTILIDKPLDWTSFQVVNKIKWKCKHHFAIKKIKVGHAGTLDPRATGLLIVCLGKNTKKISDYQSLPKTYIGTLKLGVTTPSYDTETEEENPKSIEHLNTKDIEQALSMFIGEIEQTPPLYSAIKKEGKRLYEWAREGKDTDIKSRTVNIHVIEVLDISLPFVSFKVVCSKGTYIRSLAFDIGNQLGVGAYLTDLRRTHIGDYSVENADNSWIA